MMITLILPTLGQREFEIKRLFNSLESQTYNDFEVIVVSQDNHDDISEYLKKYKLKYIDFRFIFRTTLGHIRHLKSVI